MLLIYKFESRSFLIGKSKIVNTELVSPVPQIQITNSVAAKTSDDYWFYRSHIFRRVRPERSPASRATTCVISVMTSSPSYPT
jgi:hypothetical protein